jgi:hypothetical protein
MRRALAAGGRALVIAGVVALLVRGALAFGASVGRDAGLPDGTRIDLFLLLLLGLATGVLLHLRPTVPARLPGFVAALAGAAGGLAWAGTAGLAGAVRWGVFAAATALAGVLRPRWRR